MHNPIEIDHLTVDYATPKGVIRAVNDLSLSIPPGSVFGFLGVNGAGKTTVLHALLGFLRPTAGSIRVFGQPAGSLEARTRLGFLSEHPDTYRFLTGSELLLFHAQLFGLDWKTARRRSAEALEWVGLAPAAAARRIQTYSRGMMQKICLAQALINDPDVLILDEPTGGLDPLARLAVRDLIRSLRDRRKTVFFSSHELSEVELVCDRIGILAAGRLAALGKPGDLVRADESLEHYFIRIIQTGEKQ
jgi:ABC-2 type transport system ATP-binding protein